MSPSFQGREWQPVLLVVPYVVVSAVHRLPWLGQGDKVEGAPRATAAPGPSPLRRRRTRA